MAVCFSAGVLVGWLLRDKGPPYPHAAFVNLETPPVVAAEADSHVERASADPGPTTSAAHGATAATAVATSGTTLDELRRRDLRPPIDGADIAALKGAFDERRGSDRPHEAVDIIAPRNTPVHAVDDGTIAKVFFSKNGGNTLYQFDPSGRFCYYYAHLEAYADGIHEGQSVARAQVLGYVGTSGNAPANTPHLHFTIFELTPDRHWWQGTPVDPSRVFAPRVSGASVRIP